MKNLRRIGAGVVLATGLLAAAPAAAQYNGGTVVIDSSGVRSEDGGSARAPVGSPSVVVDPSVVVSPGAVYGASAPDRASKPFNTSRGPVMAPADTSLPLHRANRGEQRIRLRPPSEARSASRAPASAPRAPVQTEPRPVARTEPKADAAPRELVETAPKSQPKPKPAAKPEPKAAPAPKKVARTEPAPKPKAEPKPQQSAPRQPAAPEKVERPARQAVAPKPAPAPKAEPKAETRVAAAPVQAAAPDVSRILFDGAAVDVSDAGRARLAEIAEAVRGGRERVQVLAYADSDTETNDWKRRVSLRRAQTVRRVLLDNGVESFRILVRALGEPSDDGPGNRVDIKIASR